MRKVIRKKKIRKDLGHTQYIPEEFRYLLDPPIQKSDKLISDMFGDYNLNYDLLKKGGVKTADQPADPKQ